MFDRLIDLILNFAQFFRPCGVVKDYEAGVVLRYGRYERMAKPGLNWLWPFFIEDVIVTTVVSEPMLVDAQSLVDSEGKSVVVETVFVITIDDPKKFLMQLEGGNDGLRLLMRGIVAQFILGRKFGDLLAQQGEDKERTASRDLTIFARRKLKPYGAGVEDVQISQLDRAKSIRLWMNREQQAPQAVAALSK